MSDQQTQQQITQQQIDNNWHLDKKIPIAFIFTLMMQTFLGGWWAASTSAELKAMREKVDTLVEDRYTKKEALLQFEFAKMRLKNLESWKEKHMAEHNKLEAKVSEK